MAKKHVSIKPVALVTAAGRGIGAACARALAQAGYSLVLQSSGGGAEVLARKLKGVGLTGSVAQPADLAKLVEAAIATRGRIDAVVNNTGHVARGELLELSDEEWHRGLDLLLLNVVRMARLVTPIMERQGGGAIVNISSFWATEPSPDFPISSTIRAGLGAFTKLYADLHAPAGIRMNSVLPGFVDSHHVEQAALATIPIGRRVRSEEVAQTVRFLLSPEAAAITGQQIIVDGGMGRAF